MNDDDLRALDDREDEKRELLRRYIHGEIDLERYKGAIGALRTDGVASAIDLAVARSALTGAYVRGEIPLEDFHERERPLLPDYAAGIAYLIRQESRPRARRKGEGPLMRFIKRLWRAYRKTSASR